MLILVELLTMSWSERCWYWCNCWSSLNVRGDFCWYWWNCWPSLNQWDELEVIFDIGGIVDHHSMRGERWFCWYWWNCWPSLNELRWEVIFVDIGGIVDHHSMSWGERWFLLILVELLTITQWVEVRGDFCWYWWNCWPSLNELKVRGDFCWYWWNCWPSLNELKWDMIFVDIGGIVDHHSMNLGERWFLLILVELLTITQWVDVRGDFVDIGGIVDHHSMSWGERWCLLILVELLTITQWVQVRGDFCWYWWNCWPSLNELRWEVIFVDIGGIVDHHSMWLRWEVIFVDIGGIVDHHSMSWSERWFLLILVELLTITQWVEVRGDFCWYWWNCWPSLNELKWEVIFVDIGGIVDHHSMNLGERWFLLILVELLTITQWPSLEVRGDFCWYWWNCWPSLNELWWEVIVVDIGDCWIVDHHSMSWSEGWFWLILVELLTITQWVEVRGDFCWYWWNCWPSLNELKWEVSWYWWNCWPSLNEFRWEVIFVDIGGIVDHHSMSWGERWFLLILV